MTGHTPTISDTFVFWPNFLLFTFVLYAILRKPFRNYWDERRKGIEDAVQAGARELAQAEEQLQYAREQFARLDHEIAQLRKEIQVNTEKESEVLLAQAKERAQRIAEQAEESIAGEQKALEVSLRKELAELVITKAKAKLQSTMNEQQDAELRQSALSGLSHIIQ